ncbi:MAG: hypothetical protein NTU53_07990 [Planctomycetota bacterium]|nr:hypothetical protein [Planctomycetota bacterium]
MRSITYTLILVALLSLIGCQSKKPEYGVERPLFLSGTTRQTWAVAPIINLSGQKQVDPILQADLLHRQLGDVAGLNPLPVNRVVEVYAALRMDRVQSEEQAALVCDLLGCDALVVVAVTDFDPFDPPKMGAALQLFRKGEYKRPANVDPYVLARRGTPLPGQQTPTPKPGFVQVVGMFDAANGSIRADLMRYAQGRTDPDGPYRERAYLVEMDRYCGFVYHSLIEQLLAKPALR